MRFCSVSDLLEIDYNKLYKLSVVYWIKMLWDIYNIHAIKLGVPKHMFIIIREEYIVIVNEIYKIIYIETNLTRANRVLWSLKVL